MASSYKESKSLPTPHLLGEMLIKSLDKYVGFLDAYIDFT